MSLLAEKLSDKGFKVWYDDFTLLLGDSLRRKIDYGLAHSRYGVVILSKKFFEKEWTQKELDGLVARENGSDKIVLPIWHGITKKEVTYYSPMLADRVAVSSDKGIDYVVKEIAKVFKKSVIHKEEKAKEIDKKIERHNDSIKWMMEIANKEPKTRKEKNLTEEAFKDPVKVVDKIGKRDPSIDAVDEALRGKWKKGKTK